MAELVMSAAEIAADPARWLALRRQGVTATDAATILGVSPWDSPFALWHRKAGNLPDVPDNDRFRLGRYLQEYVCDRWWEATGETAWRRAGGLWRDGWRMATPDFRVSSRKHSEGDKAVLECKTVGGWDGWGHGLGKSIIVPDPDAPGYNMGVSSQDVPAYVRVQALWQADVLGVPVAHVAALHRQTGEFRWYTLEVPNPAGKDRPHYSPLECWEFWQSLQAGTPPPVDGAEATTRALQHLHAGADPGKTAWLDRGLVNEWEHCREMFDHASDRITELKNRVREAMGDAKYARYVDEESQEWRIAQRIRSKVAGHWVAPHERDELRYGRKPVND